MQWQPFGPPDTLSLFHFKAAKILGGACNYELERRMNSLKGKTSSERRI
jgi:hypothetical protein